MASKDKRATRLGLLGAVGLMLLGALGTRLWFVQTVEAGNLQSRVDQRSLRTQQLTPQRGQIFDADGRIMAVSVPHLNVSVAWEALRDPVQRATTFNLLSGWVGVPVDEMESRYDSGEDSRYLPMPIADDVRPDVAAALLERSEDFPGVVVDRGFSRSYPYAPLASHVIGYTGPITLEDQAEYKALGYDTSNRGADVGRAGVEREYETKLRGTPGLVTFEVDSHNRIVREVSRVEPIDGLDLQLTIDLDVQQYAEGLLRTRLLLTRRSATNNPVVRDPFTGQRAPMSPNHGAVVNYPAPAGSMIVMDQQNGRVLALASYPTFDNRWFNQDELGEKFEELFYHPLIGPDGQVRLNAEGKVRLDPDQSSLTNRAIQGQYNLGSTFKPFVAYSAVMAGVIGPNETYYDGGTYKAESIEDSECATGIKCVWRNAICSFNNKPCVYEDMNVQRSLAVSSDVYYYHLGELLFIRSDSERATLQRWLEQFGFGARTGIDLPAETAGRLPTNASKQALWEAGVLDPSEQPNLLLGDVINLSIGQGLLAASPLQLAVGYAAIANGGTIVTPRVVLAAFPPHTPPAAEPGRVDLNGAVPLEFFDVQGRTVQLPAEIRDPIIAGLHDNVLGNGYGGRSTTAGELYAAGFYPPGAIPTAGKTGTAQGANNYPWNDSSVYAGISLDNQPGRAYTVVAYLEKSGFGSKSAAPVVKCMYMALSDPATLAPVQLSDPLDLESTSAARPIPTVPTGCMAASDDNNVTPRIYGSTTLD